jgi:hypothetical protein
MITLRKESRAILEWCMEQDEPFSTKEVSIAVGIDYSATGKMLRRLFGHCALNREVKGQTAWYTVDQETAHNLLAARGCVRKPVEKKVQYEPSKISASWAYNGDPFNFGTRVPEANHGAAQN